MNKLVKKASLILLILASILRGTLSAQEAVRMSLNDAITYALKNTNTLKTAQNGVKDAELVIKENLATGLPQVNAEVGYNFFYILPKILLPDFTGQGREPTKVSFQQKNALSGGITANQLIYSPSYNVAIRAAKLARELAKVQLTAKEVEVRNQVVNVYLPGLVLVETVKAFDKNIENLEKTLKEVTATKKAGFIEQLDVDRLELSLANLKTERENFQRRQETLLNALKLTIGYSLDGNLQLADDINSLLQPADENDLVGTIDVSKRPELAVLGTVGALTNLQLELVKASAYPTVVGFTSLTENVQFNNAFKDTWRTLPSGVLGFKASINIWDSGQRKAKVERVQLQLQNLQLQRNDVERGMTLQVMNARIGYTTAKKRLENQQKNLALAERIYITTQLKYKNGVGSSLETTTAEQQLYQSQFNVRSAQYELIVAQQALLTALGK
ncbi:MAG: TolC family protein [Saprospiraceae bacterium]|nr:TolC family protein [Saprospiraceae bacterium]